MNARTDIHAPASADFDPQAYNCVGVFDNCPDPMQGGGSQADRIALVNNLREQGYTFGHGSSHQCGHCGARIRYCALMTRDDAMEMIYVGETCLDGRFELTKGEFDALRKASQLDREAHRLLTAFTALCEQHPALAYATYSFNIRMGLVAEGTELGLAARDERDDVVDAARLAWNLSTAADIAHKARKYGDPSAKQLALVERLVGEAEAKWAEYTERELARKAAQSLIPALVAGRQTIEGEVLVVKWQEGYMPGSSVEKMLVKLDGGQRVWGSVPSSIMVDKGDRVRFDAKVEPKDGETDFAFFSRPTKASVATAAAAVAA